MERFHVGDIVMHRGKRVEIVHVITDPLHPDCYSVRSGNITRRAVHGELKECEDMAILAQYPCEWCGEAKETRPFLITTTIPPMDVENKYGNTRSRRDIIWLCEDCEKKWGR